MLNVEQIKKDFPIFKRNITYLDSAATSQKPKQVVDAISDYYLNHNSNVHRGIHTLSEEATEMYEGTREKVAKFIGAATPDEIIFTKNATESMNIVAFGWGLENLKKGDVILAVESDHHSSLVPWQIVAKRTGAVLKVLEFTEIKKNISEKVKLIAISHASNVLGTVFPVKEVCKLAKKVGALVSVDGAQAIPHLEVNVQSLGCDFYSFSAHKMLGPMGVGVLWGRRDLLKETEPYMYGGGMIESVYKDKATWTQIPGKFEAGTPNVGGVVGLGAAIDYLNKVGMKNIREHEMEITKYALEELGKISELTILGPKDSKKRTGLVSFVIKGIHSHDIAAVLSEEGIAVRSGQHCTMPLHDKLGISSSTRASFYLYNTKADVDALVDGVKKAKELLS